MWATGGIGIEIAVYSNCMKHVQGILLAFAVWCGVSASAQTLILDDTWATGSRTNWDLPSQSPWYSWTSGTAAFIGVETNALYCTNTPGITRYFWTYFTSNADNLTISGSVTNTVSNSTNIYYGYPVDLSIGQTLQLKMVFILGDVLIANGTSFVRFGLTDYDTNNVEGALNGRVIRDTSQITKSGQGISGYRLDVPIYQTLDNNAMLGVRYRFKNGVATDEQDPLGKANVWTQLGAGPSLTNYTGFLPNVPYTLTFSVQRYASSNVLAASISGGSFTNLTTSEVFTNFSYSVVDSSGSNYHRFDSFMMRFDTATIPTTLFVVKELKVEVSQLNFPITVVDKINADSLRLKWNTIAGQNYQIQYKTNVTDPSWTTVETDTATTTTLTRTNTGLTGVSQRIYRIVNVP